MRHRDLFALFSSAIAAAACSTTPAAQDGGGTALADDAGADADADASFVIHCGAIQHVTVPLATLDDLADSGVDGAADAIALDAAPVDAGPPVVGQTLDPLVCRRACVSAFSPNALGSHTCSVDSLSASTVTLSCFPDCSGRLPFGYVPPSRAESLSLGAHFARMAALEDASVAAFRGLARELRALGAPRAIVRGCQRAARDEVRHARATTALARRHGVRARFATVARVSGRPLVAIAMENAVEGCVRETFGAVVARWQARTARDPVVRAVMVRIARDEARHASLAWAIDAWARPRLDRPARARVERARADAVRALSASKVDLPSYADAVGLPAHAVQRALFAALGQLYAAPESRAAA